MNLTLAELKQKLSKPLPGVHSHLKMAPPNRADELTRLADCVKRAKKSAVLILLYHENDTLKIIYIRRSFYVGIHAGQIAFPGGRYEETDPDLKYTALREIEEEIGIENDKIEVIGRITDIYVPPSNFMISVFVGYMSEKPVFRIDEREVAEAIAVDINDFYASDVIREKEFVVPSNNYSVKAPYYKVKNAEIWGATAMVTTELLDLFKN